MVSATTQPATSIGVDQATLVVFCKRPSAAVGKQRIAAALGISAALRIAEALLACALEDARNWPGPVVLSPATREDADWAQRLLERAVDIVPQSEGNLGERLNRVDRDLRTRGHTRLVYVGTDSPTLSAGYYAAAARALTTHDVVLGPALDGGVTLMGARVAWPVLAHLPWSRSTLSARLAQACKSARATIARLPEQYDVDVVADLVLLRRDLESDRRPARQRLLTVVEQVAGRRVA